MGPIPSHFQASTSINSSRPRQSVVTDANSDATESNSLPEATTVLTDSDDEPKRDSSVKHHDIEIEKLPKSSAEPSLNIANYILECIGGDLDCFGEAWLMEHQEDTSKLKHSLTYWPRELEETPALLSFADSAMGKQYSQGEGLPGAAWEQEQVVWTDLHTLVDDPYHNQLDSRVQEAAKLFKTAVAIPLPQDSGELHGVIVLYSFGRLAYSKAMEEYLKRIDKLVGPLAKFVDVRGRYAHSNKERLRRNWARMRRAVCFATPGQLRRLHEGHLAKQPQTEAGKVEKKLELQVRDYFAKWQGGKPQPPPRMRWTEAIYSWVGAFLAIGLQGIMDLLLNKYSSLHGHKFYPIVPSFGALATIVFALPSAPLAQPRVVVLSHLLAAMIALIVFYIFHNHTLWLQGALTVATSVSAMALLGIIHPPAGAVALSFIRGGADMHAGGFFYLAVPVLSGTFIHCGVGLLINNLSRARKYPTFW